MYNYDEFSIVKVGDDEILFVKNEYKFNEGLNWSDRDVSSIKYASRLLKNAFEDDFLEGKEVSVTNINEDGTADVVTFFTNGDINWTNKQML